MQKVTEQEVSEIVNSIFSKWQPKFNEYSCDLGSLNVTSKDEKDGYLLEVESYVWRGQTIEDVFNVIIYLRGKEQMGISDLESETNKELQRIFLKIESGSDSK